MVDIGTLSEKLIGKKVGFVRLTKPVKYRQDCEVAAWYTNYESDTGDYDLTLSRDYLYKDRLHVHAEVPATVTDNYHAPLFGGVAYGKSRDDRGNRGKIPIKFGWAEAAAENQYHQEGVRFYINRDYLDATIEYTERMFIDYGNGFDAYWKKYLAEPRNPYESNISMACHFGQNVNYWGRLLQEILRRKENRFGWLSYCEQEQRVA